MILCVFKQNTINVRYGFVLLAFFVNILNTNFLSILLIPTKKIVAPLTITIKNAAAINSIKLPPTLHILVNKSYFVNTTEITTTRDAGKITFSTYIVGFSSIILHHINTRAT